MRDNNIYVRTYFRIEAGYIWGKGLSDEQYKKFTDEIRSIFKDLGFTIKEPDILGACLEVIRGAENLYCHPQSLSGYIKKESVKEIEKALQKAKTFKYYKTDTYEEAYNYTERELNDELEQEREKIVQRLLEAFKTKRSNLYKSPRILWDLRTEIKFFRDESNLKSLEGSFVRQVFETLVFEGKIKESENYKVGKIYRTVKEAILCTSEKAR